MQLTQQQALISLALHAAYADGTASEVERESVMRMASRFRQEGVELPSNDPVERARTIQALAAQLRDTDVAPIAYEMAASVCEADRSHVPEEQAFLADLRVRLGLETSASDVILGRTTSVAHAHEIPPAPSTVRVAPPVLEVMPSQRLTPSVGVSSQVPPSADDPDLESMVLNHAMLAGALELLPSSLATMAIIPVQMRLVYRVGQRYGFELDQGHIRDLLATLGVGLTSQVVEGFLERTVRGLLGKVAGGLGGSLLGQATSSGLSFATTYALGKLAQQYYAGGRRFSAIELKSLYDSLARQGRDLHAQYLPQIRQKAGSLDLASLPALLRRS